MTNFSIHYSVAVHYVIHKVERKQDLPPQLTYSQIVTFSIITTKTISAFFFFLKLCQKLFKHHLKLASVHKHAYIFKMNSFWVSLSLIPIKRLRFHLGLRILPIRRSGCKCWLYVEDPKHEHNRDHREKVAE